MSIYGNVIGANKTVGKSNVVHLDMTTGLAANVWTAVAYGNNRFVAIAKNSNKAAYSTDGENWTMTTLPSTELWSSIAFGGSYFVAVASGYDKYAYSEDGITWGTFSMPSSSEWRSVAYGDGVFVAVAPDNVCAYGLIGGGFSASTMSTQADWCDVTYNGYYFAAIASDSNAIELSHDGSYWSSSSCAAMYPGLVAAASSPRYESVAIGIQTSGKFQYTTDCYNWYEASVPYGDWIDIAYGDGKFVAIEHNANRAIYSDDGGATWYGTTLPSDDTWECIIYGGDKFVALASNSSAIAYSYDGVVWYSKKPTLLDNDGNDITMEIGAQFSDWVKIYDSGYTDGHVNAFANIDVSGYKNIMVAIRSVNITRSAGGISGAIIFKGVNGKDYAFKNIFSNLIRNTNEISGGVGIFKVMNGFIVCENAMRAVSAENMLTDTDGLGADNLQPLGGGIVRCTSPLSTMMVSNASLSADYYYGAGSRVIVWGCRL